MEQVENAYYVASVVRTYRHVIDNFQDNKEEAIKKAKEILSFDLARKKTTYHFIENKNLDFLSYKESSQTGLLLGKIKEIEFINNEKIGLIESGFDVNDNDSLRFYNHDDKIKINYRAKIISKDNNSLKLLLPSGYDKDDLVYLVSSKMLKMKYHQIISKSLTKYKRHPGNLSAPEIESNNKINKQVRKLPDGIYLKLNNLNDFYKAQSLNPVKVILNLNGNNFKNLISLNDQHQVKKGNVIIELLPDFFNREESNLELEVNNLVESGYKDFIINNIGHIQLFKDKSSNLISGQFLYTFNGYSINFLKENNINFFTSPLENNKSNLFNETKKFNPYNWLIIVFAYPELFHITSDLTKKYKFNFFKDSHDNSYRINSTEDITTIIPDKPFSIIYKIDLLKHKGFNKFIIDFSNFNFSKNDCKIIKEAISKKNKIPNSVKFNWKSGFYKKAIIKKEDKSSER